MKRIFVNGLLLLFIVVGCSPTPKIISTPIHEEEPVLPYTTDPICDPNTGKWSEENDSPYSMLDSEVITWDMYRDLYSVPAYEISKITIEYQYLGWEFLTRCYEINLTGKEYKTKSGFSVDQKKVYEFSNSFLNLRLSGGEKGCINHTDDYPNFRIAIEYSNGQKAFLYSASNCTSTRIPWNLVYNNKLYFQTTGEIPASLYNLLASFDKEMETWWKPELVATTITSSGSDLSLISNYHPPEIERLSFSEKQIFMQVVRESGVIDPYLANFKLIGMESLKCDLTTTCMNVYGKASLKSENGLYFLVGFAVAEDGTITLDEDAQAAQLRDVDIQLAAHPIIRMAKSAKTDLHIEVNCDIVTTCKDETWCSAAFANKQQTPTSEVLACQADFYLDYWQKYVYIPTLNEFWVKTLIYDLDETQAENNKNVFFPIWKPDLDPLINLFKIPDSDFFQKYTNGISVYDRGERCNSINLDYLDEAWRNGASKTFQSQLEKYYPFKEKELTSPSIWGYCVFIDENGVFGIFDYDSTQ